MGITKVEELANCDIQRLTERFGKMGLWLKQAANGLDFSEIEESEEAVKSISRSITFKENTNDPIKIAGYLEMLAEFIGSQKIRLVGVGVSKLRERDVRQTLIADFT